MSTFNYDLCPFHGPTCIREIADGSTVDAGDCLHHTTGRPWYDGGDAAAQANADAAAASATAADASATSAAVFNNPTGTIIWWGGNTLLIAPPAGWLVCDGSEIDRTTYSDLFDVIGVLYGNGDGVTTFNIPDLVNGVAVGLAGIVGTTDTPFPVTDTGAAAPFTLSLTPLIRDGTS